MTHDIKTGEGNYTVQVELVYAIGPITTRVSPETRNAIFPDAALVWCFQVWCAGGILGLFYPDDEGLALMERARLAEAVGKVRSVQDANNVAETFREEIRAVKDGDK